MVYDKYIVMSGTFCKHWTTKKYFTFCVERENRVVCFGSFTISLKWFCFEKPYYINLLLVYNSDLIRKLRK